MDAEKSRRSAMLSWLFVGVLVALSVTLGALQYRWIGEVSRAERERLRGELQGSLVRLSRDFNSEITGACAALVAGSSDSSAANEEEAYAARWVRWRDSHTHAALFRRIALVRRQDNSIALRDLNLDEGVFHEAEWPADWKSVRDRLSARLGGDGPGPRGRPGPLIEDEVALIDIPRFGRPGEAGAGSFTWLLVELDLDYVRAAFLPELLRHHLGGGKADYQVEVVARDNPSTLLYSSEERSDRIGNRADASVNLFNIQFDQILRRAGLFRPGEGRRGPRGRFGPPPEMAAGPERGRWHLSVRHHAGSLEAVVNRARVRNLAVTTGILLLMLAAVAALVRFTQRAQKLARVEMEFVAGVSHELRTPITVIRTAAHNLGRGVVRDEKQIQRYGTLIRQEAERLGAIVEQVLRFSKAKAGSPIGAREPVSVPSLVSEALSATAATLDGCGCEIERRIATDLPPVLADPIALNQAVQNLLINAAKYGSAGGWIGISAAEVEDGGHSFVEIRVRDRGAGIPAAELGQIFDPFYRGKKAIEDQIHGTGLGLNLVKRIVEAHDGTVKVESKPDKGAEFAIRIPAAPAERVNEFADTSRRG